jgi:Uncharacterized protein related to plant photosystem II stability/assembly factor
MKYKLSILPLLIFILTLCYTSYPQSDWYWQNPLPQGNTLNGVCFTDANTGTAVGNGGTILRTTDGGITWTRQESGTTLDLYGVSFSNADTGTIVGGREIYYIDDYRDFYGIILHTTNGGVTWTKQLEGSFQLFSVSFTDNNTGTAVGCDGSFGFDYLILRTTDGGTTWTEMSPISEYPPPHADAFRSVCFTDAN